MKILNWPSLSILSKWKVLTKFLIMSSEIKGKYFFVDGPVETGKTYLYRALLARVRSTDRIAISKATSAISKAGCGDT